MQDHEKQVDALLAKLKRMTAKREWALFQSSTPQIQLGALPAVIEIAGISKSEIWRRCKAGRFPQPVRLGARCTRWNLAEVREWAAAQLAKREQQEVA